jgi:plasmid stabilization system protein ParE
LVKIWQHIAEHDPAAADRFIDHLTRRFDDLLAFPELGAAVPALGQGLRRHVGCGDRSALPSYRFFALWCFDGYVSPARTALQPVRLR